MGEVVRLHKPPPEPPKGNGAREAAIYYWSNFARENGMCPCIGCAGHMADNLLAWLWREGFKVGPLEPSDEEPPAA